MSSISDNVTSMIQPKLYSLLIHVIIVSLYTLLSFYSILIFTLYNCIQMNGISTHLHVGADSTSCSHELPAAAAEGEHYTGLAI